MRNLKPSAVTDPIIFGMAAKSGFPVMNKRRATAGA
jgi:hypothetical protein